MTTTHKSTTRDSKTSLAQAALADLLAETARQGFYGAATLTVSLQDGHIQYVRIATERMLK